jgi:glutamine synthetase type III
MGMEKEIIMGTKNVKFEKNGYSQDWHEDSLKL